MAEATNTPNPPARRSHPALATADGASRWPNMPAPLDPPVRIPMPIPRRLLIGLAALLTPATGRAVESPSNPDARLLRLCAAYHSASDACDVLAAPWANVAGPAPAAVTQAQHDLVVRIHRLRPIIARTQARTFAGLVAKARAAMNEFPLSFDGTVDFDRDGALAYTLHQDIVRLFGGGMA